MKRIVLCLTAVALLLAVLGPVPAMAGKTVNLTYSIFLPEKHAQAQAAIAWAKEVEKRTNGAVNITIFAGGTLTKGPKVYEGVVSGISDIGNSCFAYTSGRFPVMQAIDLPMGYPNGKVASRVANDFGLKHADQGLKDVKLLYVHAHGPGLLHTQKPVRTLADLKGMKIRSTGFSAEVVSALGGVPVAMGQGDAYEALKTGVVEGTITPIETLKGWKQAEVVNYTTECSAVGYTTAMYVVMNKAKWNSLSPAVQKIMEEVSAEYVDIHGAAWDAADEAGRAFTLEKGNEIIPLSEEENKLWAEKAQPVITKYEESVPNGAVYVQEIRDAIKKAE
ncbi:TRAP transporter substrate-binding protein [Desulfatibacillum aliphaticivorans]|uniref:TRAP-type C4-dicarboxylate transport system, DctP subunit n=1 Tax=Desulfatibacillum aliphaticivorans TaxID=218208 RepID=B8FND8_DESAL|nr:TRAP transporter substrate-binding protein [Desulfatibacillum aliphaticivorans]ACL06107.1 TRAP-type C4-dicarboxylate transport system, DctP subunit [Desulfatibacillum aliphaticivorans]